MSTGEAVTANLHAVSLLLDRLQDVGLPLPSYYVVGQTGAHLHFDGLDNLTDWALWAEERIAEERHGADRHHVVRFNHEGLPFELLYVERAVRRAGVSA